MPTPVATHGLYLQLGDGDLASSPTYTTVAQIVEFGDLSHNSTMVDVTGFSSTNGYEEVFPSGIHRYDPFTIQVIYDPADGTHDTSTGLEDVASDEAKRAFKYVMPDASTHTATFEAYIENFTKVAELENVFRANVTLRLTGEPTFA